MPIELCWQVNSHDIYKFNQSRINRVLGAKTPDEATRMGVLDTILDWAWGGVKREAIRQMYDSITAPGQNACSPEFLLERFELLKAMFEGEQKAQFKCKIESLDTDGRWEFILSIGGTAIHESRLYQNGPRQYWSVCALKQALLSSLYNQLPPEDAKLIHNNRQAFLERNVRCMSDDRAAQLWITEHLDDPLSNFARCEQTDLDHFHAVFQKGNEPEFRLQLSNRILRNGEMSGATLMNALQEKEYSSLRELAVGGYLPPDGARLRAATSAWLDAAGRTMGFDDGSALLGYLTGLRGPEKKAVSDMLSGVMVGDTNLAVLCFAAEGGNEPGHSAPGRALPLQHALTKARTEDLFWRDRVPQDSREMIKDDLVETWKATGNGTKDVEWAGSDGKAENDDIAVADGKAESDDEVVKLRRQVWTDYIERNNLQFDETGTLTLTMNYHEQLNMMKKIAQMEDGERTEAIEKVEKNKQMALSGFMREHFHVEPGEQAFQHVSNNLLSFFHQGANATMAKKAMALSGGEGNLVNVLNNESMQITFTFSVDEGNPLKVRVTGESRMGYRNYDDDSPGLTDYSKYMFVRRQTVVISGEYLTSDLSLLEEEARDRVLRNSLLSVKRFDTLEFAS
jgi:hypothetical protein